MNKFFTCFLLLISTQIWSQEVLRLERNFDQEAISQYFDSNLAPFYHGVASGDPLSDAVIIWTRVTTNDAQANVQWKMATDAEMHNVVKSGSVTTNADKDFTVKIDVTDLQAATTYYYQFKTKGRNSLIGRTRTAPENKADVEDLNFAVVSCSNYQEGYFNAYQEISEKQNIDAVIHLGDYIYEYESGGYGYNEETQRGHLPENEIVSLEDYRVRYSFYRLDPMLRAAHQQHPFITVWDDHEFADNANKYGAVNHQPETEGDWETRKNNAYKAYFEWLPVRANSVEEYRLYRTIQYGNLVDLIMLDTRIEGRNTQRESEDILGRTDAISTEYREFAKKWFADKPQNRTTVKQSLELFLPNFVRVQDGSNKSDSNNALSKDEFNLVVNNITDLIYNTDKANREAKDNKIAEIQPLLSKSIKFNAPDQDDSENKTISKSMLGTEQLQWFKDQLNASDAQWKVIGNQVMFMPWYGIPSNDAWDGYNEERNEIINFIDQQDINNIVVLTGDIHSMFAGEIRKNFECKAVEFITPSITSQNLDFLGSFIASIAEGYTLFLNPHMMEVDLINHGYFILNLNADRAQADWYYMNNIRSYDSGEMYDTSWLTYDDFCGTFYGFAPCDLNAKSNRGELAPSRIDNAYQPKEEAVLVGIYPNPVSEKGNIHFYLNDDVAVKIHLYDTSGNLVKSILDKPMKSGLYNVSFEAASLAKGIYFITFETPNSKTNKQVIVR